MNEIQSFPIEESVNTLNQNSPHSEFGPLTNIYKVINFSQDHFSGHSDFFSSSLFHFYNGQVHELAELVKASDEAHATRRIATNVDPEIQNTPEFQVLVDISSQIDNQILLNGWK